MNFAMKFVACYRGQCCRLYSLFLPSCWLQWLMLYATCLCVIVYDTTGEQVIYVISLFCWLLWLLTPSRIQTETESITFWIFVNWLIIFEFRKMSVLNDRKLLLWWALFPFLLWWYLLGISSRNSKWIKLCVMPGSLITLYLYLASISNTFVQSINYLMDPHGGWLLGWMYLLLDDCHRFITLKVNIG